jgi:hypothetical protein
MAAEPIAAYRDAQRLAVRQDTWKCSNGASDGPTLLDDTASQHKPAPWGQYSVSVDHEGLLFVAVKW